MTLRTLIVDDEPIARRVLRDELAEMPEVTVVGEAEGGAEALAAFDRLRPALVFLDQQMPEMSGLEVARALAARPAPPAIVMVTAFEQHALPAFEAGAVDYLLKPAPRARLAAAVARACRLQPAAAPPAEEPAAAKRRVLGRIGEEFFFLPQHEVLAVQARDGAVWIHTSGRKFQALDPLMVLEQKLLRANFHRIHRSTLVNLDHVAKMSALSSRRWLITLSNQQSFIASKRLVPTVWRRLG